MKHIHTQVRAPIAHVHQHQHTQVRTHIMTTQIRTTPTRPGRDKMCGRLPHPQLPAPPDSRSQGRRSPDRRSPDRRRKGDDGCFSAESRTRERVRLLFKHSGGRGLVGFGAGGATADPERQPPALTPQMTREINHNKSK